MYTRKHIVNAELDKSRKLTICKKDFTSLEIKVVISSFGQAKVTGLKQNVRKGNSGACMLLKGEDSQKKGGLYGKH